MIGRVYFDQQPTFSRQEFSHAWVLDPGEIAGLSNPQIMQRVGWTQETIDSILKTPISKRRKLMLTLIEDPGNLKVPTWDEVRIQTHQLIEIDEEFKEAIGIAGISIDHLDEYFEILKKTPVNKIEDLPYDKVKDLRDILEGIFGNNPLFTGKGFTVTKDGKFGLREWFWAQPPKAGFDIKALEKAGFKLKEIELKWE